MIDKNDKAKIFWGYVEYINKKGKEAIQKGLDSRRVIKLEDYLVEELGYTIEEAQEIKKDIRRDWIDEKKDENRK